MATTKSKAIVRHKQPTVSKARFEMVKAAAASGRRKAREVAAKRAGTLVGTGTGALAGYLERTGKVSPKFTSPMALGIAGAVLAFVVPETGMGRGKIGQAAAEAGSGLLAVAGYKLGLGQAVIGADDEPQAESAGDWGAAQGWNLEPG